MIKQREAHITIVTGGQGVGKTVRQKLEAEAYTMDNPQTGKKGRKVLVIDCNPQSGSYDGVKTIDYNTMPKDVVKHGKVIDDNSAKRCASIKSWPENDKSFRRVVTVKKDGQAMSGDEMNQLCLDLLQHFSVGMLILEDTNAYLHSAAQKQFLSNFIRVRHKTTDLVIILQTWRVIPPRVAGNMSMMRLHKTYDTCDEKKDHMADGYEMAKIGELIVNMQHELGNKRYFVYLDFRNKKIIGASEKSFNFACKQYLLINKKILTNYADMYSISKDQALVRWIKKKAETYLPNGNESKVDNSGNPNRTGAGVHNSGNPQEKGG